MKILYSNLNILDIRYDGRNNTKSSVFLLRYFEKQNSWVKISENDMKDIIGIYDFCWRVHLR